MRAKRPEVEVFLGLPANLEQPAVRSTRSAAKAGRALDQATTSKLNVKQTCELLRLGSTFYLKADIILEESRRQEQQFNEQMPDNNNTESETAESTTQSGRDMATFGLEEMIDQLFASDFAFFVCDAMMEMQKENQDPEVKMEEQVKNNKELRLFNEVKNSKTHLVDLLDATIRNDLKMKESDCLIKLKHIVSKLKEDIPENFQEAHNHPS
jgi:hypothetical protein